MLDSFNRLWALPHDGQATIGTMDPEPPAEVWVDERVVVGRSAIDGRGLFATDDLPAGTVVVRLGGELVDSATLSRLLAAADPDAAYIDTIAVDEDAHLVLPPGTTAHFANHSCDPTLWHVGPYELAARRDLRAGDELTVDYGTNSAAAGFAMDCRCGSPVCRRRITSEDWRRPELRLRYAGHWTAALQRRIDRHE
jgi:hypothetical protein